MKKPARVGDDNYCRLRAIMKKIVRLRSSEKQLQKIAKAKTVLSQLLNHMNEYNQLEIKKNEIILSCTDNDAYHHDCLQGR